MKTLNKRLKNYNLLWRYCCNIFIKEN